VNREAKRRERGDPGFPKRASLLKTTASPNPDKVPYLHGWAEGRQARRIKRQEEKLAERHGDDINAPIRQRDRYRKFQELAAQQGRLKEPSSGSKLSALGEFTRPGTRQAKYGLMPPALQSDDDPRITHSLNKEDAIKTGKAILALPYNLATQRIMGKDAPAAVSADDRLKQAVLILLKQQQTAEEVGRDVLATGGIGIKTKDAPAGQGAIEGAAAGKGGGLVGRKTYGAAKGAVGLAGSAAKKLGAAAKGAGSLWGLAPPSPDGAAGVGPKATVDVAPSPTGIRAPVTGKTDGAAPGAALTDPSKRIGKPETTPVTPKKKPTAVDPSSQRIGGGPESTAPDFNVSSDPNAPKT